jgi:hypothetical protein
MSYRVKMILPVVGMFLLGCVVVAAVTGEVRELRQPLPASLDDLAAVRLVEVRDAAGQIVLRGSFTMATQTNGDVEGEATLAATGVDEDAAGKAEVEVSTRNGNVDKELEVEVSKLAPGTTFNLFIDGQQAAIITTNQRGAAELEMTSHPSD